MAIMNLLIAYGLLDLFKTVIEDHGIRKHLLTPYVASLEERVALIR